MKKDFIFPTDKYKIIKHGNEVIALSTYAGKAVKGTAKCDPRDEFNSKTGKNLAIARCACKISTKRVKHAKKKYEDAVKQYQEACKYLTKMDKYKTDAIEALNRDTLIKNVIERQLEK